MKPGMVWLMLFAVGLLLVGCAERLPPIQTERPTIVQITDTPKLKMLSPTPTSTESKPAWLPTPPENPTTLKITDNTEWVNEKPVWSPDGSQILFMSNRECVKQYNDDEWGMRSRCWEWDLYLIDADGSNEVRLTDVQFVDGWDEAWLRWSPDGKRVAFTFASFLDTHFEKVYAFSLDRARQRPLGLDDMEVLVDKGEDYLVGGFEWSPDGKKYAYDYFSSDEVPPRRYDIVVVDIENGGEVYRNTTVGDTLCGFGAWSPDGEAILVSCFQNTVDWEWHIDWIDLNTEEQRLLIEDAHYPIWSPDGKWILYYFDKKAGGTRNVLFHLETGEVVPLLFQNELWHDRNWSPNGQWLAFSNQEYNAYTMWYNISLLDMSWLEMEWDK